MVFLQGNGEILTQLICFPNKEMPKKQGYKKLNKKKTNLRKLKIFFVKPLIIDIDTLKRWVLFQLKARNLCISKPWSFSFHEALKRMHELISDHRPVPTGRAAEIPCQKWAAQTPALNSVVQGRVCGRDSTALHGSP